MSRARPATLLALALLLACADEGKRPLGANCTSDEQCRSGLCAEARCLDPDGDEDGDGLANGFERALGTDPLAADSDGDGADDPSELGQHDNPADFDGDQVIDALESDTADRDGDCLVDERDPDDLTAVSDPAVLADLGCCCDGRCALRGIGSTARCVDGALVCERPDPDRDGDGTPDPCDTPALVLDDASLELGCAEACERQGACADPPASQDACRTACRARASAEGLWLANDYCLAAACDRDACFGAGEDFAIPAACTEACARADGCGVFALGSAGTRRTCELSCAGAAHALGEPALAAFDCLAALPAEGCRLVDALPCVLGDRLCRDACARVGARGDEGVAACRPGSPTYSRYPTPETCLASCGALGGFGQVAFLGCAIARGCADDEGACVTAPDPAPEGCLAACGALGRKCPNNPLSDSSVCRAFCSGLVNVIADPDLVQTLACIEALDGCPAGDDSAVQVLLTCAAGIDDRCAATCARFSECTGSAPETCERGCTGLVLAHPERIEPTFACLAEDPPCDALAPCAPADPTAVCAPACEHLIACEPDRAGGLGACLSECQTGIASDLDRLAAWHCRATAPGCEVACDDLPAAPPPAACREACAGDDACIEAAYGVCERACQGSLAGLGAANETTARCVVDALGRRCDPTGPRRCEPR